MILHRYAVRLSLLALAIATAFPFAARAQDVEHGRISFADESGLIRGESDDEWSYASLNSLVMPGDAIWADEEGVLEIEFAGGAFIRLADGSRLDVVSTPPETLLQGWTGSFYIQRVAEYSGDLVFETPAGRIHVQPDSLVRIDILEDGPTAVSVRSGAAVIHTDVGASVRVADGERSYIDPGYLPSVPDAYDRTIEDAFDTWNRERALAVVLGDREVPIAAAGYAEAPIGVSDLNDYGEWVYIDNKPCWRPTVVADFVPYREGRWSYVPAQGHVWVGHHPFSYVTSHHGYWHHHHHYGWVWSYHRPYSPAYAFSVRYGDYFLWAPISAHGYPVHFGVDLFSIGGFSFSFGFTTFSYAHNLFHGHHYSHAYYPQHHQAHHDYHYWNLHARDSRYDPHVRPHWPDRQARTYAPSRVLRGPSRNHANTALARERVARLDSTIKRDHFAIRNVREHRGARTEVARVQRSSRVRDVQVRSSDLSRGDRSARATDTRRDSADRSTRGTLTNREARTVRPVSSGSTSRRDDSVRDTSRERGDTSINRERGNASSGRDKDDASSSRSGRQKDSSKTSPRSSSLRLSMSRPDPESVTRTRASVGESRSTRSSASYTRDARYDSPASRPSPSSVRSTRASRVGEPPTQRYTRSSVSTRSSSPRTTSVSTRTESPSSSTRSRVSRSTSTRSTVTRPSTTPTTTRSSVSSNTRSSGRSTVSSGSTRSYSSTSSSRVSSSRSSVSSSPSRSSSSRSSVSSSPSRSSSTRSSISSSGSRSSSSRSSVSSSPSRSSSSRSSVSSSSRSSGRSSVSSSPSRSSSSRSSASSGSRSSGGSSRSAVSSGRH